ncbi:MAG: hypothetical protein QXU98_13760 [Candidatus Parvarchaeota archaeon]
MVNSRKSIKIQKYNIKYDMMLFLVGMVYFIIGMLLGLAFVVFHLSPASLANSIHTP